VRTERLRPLHLAQQPDETARAALSSSRPISRFFPGRCGLRVPPELAYPVGPVEVGEAQDMVEFGASRACRQADDPGEVRDPL
jgi:hypothetical protein